MEGDIRGLAVWEGGIMLRSGRRLTLSPRAEEDLLEDDDAPSEE